MLIPLVRIFVFSQLLLFATVASSETLPNHASYDDIIARGTLDVAVYEDFPPFSFRKNGKLAGIDAELARLIAEKLGVKAVFRELPAGETVADDLRNAIWKGHYLGGGISDLMMHVPTNRDFARRNEMVVIMGDYYQDRLKIARNVEKTGDSTSVAVYRYEKVGVELDSLPDFFLSGFGGGILRDNVVHYRTIDAAATALVNREIAAVFAPLSQLQAALGENAADFSIDSVLAPGLVNDKWQLGVAVSNHTRQLGYEIEDILVELVQNGEVENIFTRHGLSWTPPDQ